MLNLVGWHHAGPKSSKEDILRKLKCDNIVLGLAQAPIDARTGNRVLYGVSWVADRDSMIGQRNEDWVRRELDWFNSGSNSLHDMEGPVPQLFQACAAPDGSVNSAYGHILFTNQGRWAPTLYQRIVNTFVDEGLASRHAVAIISDRNVHVLAKAFGRNDFICTNALNVMIDDEHRVHIIAQMRSMDAVFGYRADYSMWDDLMKRLIGDLNVIADKEFFPHVSRGNIEFQVANLHVYPRHLALLQETAEDIHDRLDRQVWQDQVPNDRLTVNDDPHRNEPEGTGEARS